MVVRNLAHEYQIIIEFFIKAMLDWVSPLQWSFKGAVGVALIKTFSVSGLCSSGPQVASTSLLLTSWRRFWNTVRIQTGKIKNH